MPPIHRPPPHLLPSPAAGRDGPGSASPGRALQGVRDKLDAYYAAQQQRRTYAGGHMAVYSCSWGAGGGGVLVGCAALACSNLCHRTECSSSV
jgi:hypothetical protein